MIFNFGVWFSIVNTYWHSVSNVPDKYRCLLRALDEELSNCTTYDGGTINRIKKCKEKPTTWISEKLADADFVTFSASFFASKEVKRIPHSDVKNMLLEIAISIMEDERIDDSQTFIEDCNYIEGCENGICKSQEFLKNVYSMHMNGYDEIKVRKMIFGALKFACKQENILIVIEENGKKKAINDWDIHKKFKKTKPPKEEFTALYEQRYLTLPPNNFASDFSFDFDINESMQKAYNEISNMFDKAYPFCQGRAVLLAEDGVGDGKVAQMYAKINSSWFYSGVFLSWCDDRIDDRISDFLSSVNFRKLDEIKSYETFLSYFDENEADGKYVNNKWLIVFCDVNSQVMYDRILSLLPQNPHGSVLFTSNKSDLDWQGIVGENIVSLNCPSEETSMHSLFLSIDNLFGKKVFPISADKLVEVREICTKIVNQLGCNPKTIKYVAKHLFYTFIKQRDKNPEMCIVNTLNDFCFDLEFGSEPIIDLYEVESEESRFRIYKDGSIYKLNRVR
jgi:hypothetical protein